MKAWLILRHKAEVLGGLAVEIPEPEPEIEPVKSIREFVDKYCILGEDHDGHNIPDEKRFRVRPSDLYDAYEQVIWGPKHCNNLRIFNAESVHYLE